MQWNEFKLNRQLLRAIEDLSFETPTEIQRKVIPLALGGQDVIGIAQTGTGKTAAYLLPILMKLKFAQGNMPRGLVLAPTKELVVQIAEHAELFSAYTDLRIVSLYGGVGPKVQLEQLENGVDLIISTIGRFMDFYLQGEIQVKQIKMLVLDEADRIMDMGFMPKLRKLFEVIPVHRQNFLFSATFPPKVESLSEEFLDFPRKVEITPQATPARSVMQVSYHIPNFKAKLDYLEYLLQQPDYERVMVFVRNRNRADNIFRYLSRKKLGEIRVIHSNKAQNTRINAVQLFREGKVRVLVSTDVTARGIDIRKISHVINFDVPVLYEDYVHRIGRTGRACDIGTAITFVGPDEEYHVRKIEEVIREKIPVEAIPPEITVLPTPPEEAKKIAMEIDRQRRKEDPTFQGAFHEKKKMKGKKKR